VWATPTKPGRAAVGLELVKYAAGAAQASAEEGPADGGVPWFAIGGIDHGNVEQVVEAGARRIVVVRAVTEADDPCSRRRFTPCRPGRPRFLTLLAQCYAGRTLCRSRPGCLHYRGNSS
jgi:hypothetical protein